MRDLYNLKSPRLFMAASTTPSDGWTVGEDSHIFNGILDSGHSVKNTAAKMLNWIEQSQQMAISYIYVVADTAKAWPFERWVVTSSWDRLQ